jgi:hypothetical protein
VQRRQNSPLQRSEHFYRRVPIKQRSPVVVRAHLTTQVRSDANPLTTSTNLFTYSACTAHGSSAISAHGLVQSGLPVLSGSSLGKRELQKRRGSARPLRGRPPALRLNKASHAVQGISQLPRRPHARHRQSIPAAPCHRHNRARVIHRPAVATRLRANYRPAKCALLYGHSYWPKRGQRG